MNAFDAGVLSFINGFAHRSLTLDLTLAELTTNNLLKGGVVVPMLWWAWFQRGGDEARRREIVLSTILACLVSLFFARALAHVLPFRIRPIHDAALHFRMPYGAQPEILFGWSAFPSDHAVMFFTLGTGLLFASRLFGVLALLHATLVICLPRIFFGLHYPSDVVVGAVIGAAFAWVATRPAACARVARPILAWSERHAGLFYGGLFLLSMEMAILFDDLRTLAEFAARIASSIHRHYF